MSDDKPDLVNHPPHYRPEGSEFQAIDLIEALQAGFHAGNAIKYLVRFNAKGNPKQDLEKTLWYLRRWHDGLEIGSLLETIPPSKGQLGRAQYIINVLVRNHPQQVQLSLLFILGAHKSQALGMTMAYIRNAICCVNKSLDGCA